MAFHLLGTGSPLVDYSLAVTEEFLQKYSPCAKGATVHISNAEKNIITDACNGSFLRTPGGSAANTLRTFTALGGKGAHFGKTGNDADGDFFCRAMRQTGCDDSLLLKDEIFSTGYCLSLVTPDGERTMLSDLGASLKVTADDVKKIDFSRYDFLLLEGYLIREKWLTVMLTAARAGSCKIALDLNNFAMVEQYREIFTEIINSGIDLLFANEAEMQALFPGKERQEIVKLLPEKVPMAIFKLGKDGALIVKKDSVTAIPAIPTVVKDTTGAGDFFAAGFFYGLSLGLPHHLCGQIGTLCASAIIAGSGTVLSKENWNSLKNKIRGVK